MWFNLLSMGVKAGTHIYKNKQQTKMLMSDAQMRNASAMAKGEMEYKGKLLESNSNGWKDEFVLIIVSAPIMLLIWSIFSDDPTIMTKVEMFFEYFNNKSTP